MIAHRLQVKPLKVMKHQQIQGNIMRKKRLFVLDTNVLMHDPACLFRFQEHDLFLPMIVIEELDKHKKGLSEVARNARQTSRFLDHLLSKQAPETLKQGLPLSLLCAKYNLNDNINPNTSGHLYFETTPPATQLDILPGQIADNAILATAASLKTTFPDHQVILVSKDTNMRVKALMLGQHAEDYQTDRVLDDAELLYTGFRLFPADFWQTYADNLTAWQEQGKHHYLLKSPIADELYPNQGIFIDGKPHFEARVVKSKPGKVELQQLEDYRHSHHAWGIYARNDEQNYALNLLNDPEIDFVTLTGQAGTGKTLLTLASALDQTLEKKRYSEIIVTRVTVPIGEDIGFLPGTEEEKMTPWMGALMDNLEVLVGNQHEHKWQNQTTGDLIGERVKIKSLNFMRGRTFLNRFVIIDEAQNLTAKQMKALVTRAGPGTKIVCLGNLAQIDTPYLSEINSGLTYIVDRFKTWPHSGHITLQRGERSRLADYASHNL